MKTGTMITGDILSTKELCRITFNDGNFERLMVQEYISRPPFYYITQGEKFCRVETADHDINKIIEQLELELNTLVSHSNKSYVQNNEKVREVYEYYSTKYKEFISTIKRTTDTLTN